MKKNTSLIIFLFWISIINHVSAEINYDLLRCNHYGIEHGLPQSSITDIHQDSYGYLWMSTLDGISKFNGYEFKNYYFEPNSRNSLISNSAFSLSQFNKTTLMISTAAGISFFDTQKQEFKNIYTYNKQLGSIKSTCIDSSRNIFVSSSNGVFSLQITDTIGDSLTFKWDKIHNEFANLIGEKERIILQTKSGLLIYKNKKLNKISNLNGDLKFIKKINKTTYAIWQDNYISLVNSDNSFKASFKYYVGQNIEVNDIKWINNLLWVATNQGVLIITLNKNHTSTQQTTWLKHNKYNPNSILSDKVASIFQDSFGIIWIGCKKGLNKIDPTKQRFIGIKRSDVLNLPYLHNDCQSFYEDEEHFYSGYQDGILVYNKLTQKYQNASLNNSILSITETPSIGLIVGTDNGIKKLVKKDTSWVLESHKTFFKIQDSLGSSSVYKIISNENNLILATNKGLFVLFQDGSFCSKKLQGVLDVYKDKNNVIWCVSSPAAIHKVNITQNKTIELNTVVFKKLKQLSPLSIYSDGKNIWIGLFGGGLLKYNLASKESKHFSTKDGLPNNSVYGILPDNNNHLWLSTGGGLSKFNLIEHKFINYTFKDGLVGMEFNLGAYFKSNSKNLFFGGTSGYNIVDSDKRLQNFTPPIVYFSGVYNEGENLLKSQYYSINDDGIETIELPFRKNSFTFKVDGLHFGDPHENIYAYSFIGLEDEWVSNKNKREFYFANINPGEYTFNVRVANSDGVWSPEVKKINLVINPPYWLTWWFITFIILVVAGLVVFIYLSRISLVKKQKQLLEKMVKNRTKEVEAQKTVLEEQKALIEEEKDKEEKLLLNILPAETARELMNTGRAAPKSYRKATVMFADFKNFTRIAENLRPSELVAELDDSFAHFDDLVGEYNIEKIKTSGDAYMCVGGIPIRNNTNPVDCVLMALEFQRYMEQKRKLRSGTGKPQWHLRIGIHTGELIAGVVGKKKFLYDVWGDTVNIAARMESTSDPGKVNVSGATYDEIKEYFDCEYRGKLPVKNKGAIDMYYVHRIKPDLSEDGKGIKPNKRFLELLNFNSYSDITYNKVRKFIIAKLKSELPKNLYYHGVHHTLDIIKSAERIGKAEGLDAEEIMLIKLAALYHDAGFLLKYRDNEEEGAKLAKEYLPKYGFTDQQIEIVVGMIMATRVPQCPTNHLEEIICDADLDYLGRSKEEFEKISGALQKELLEYGFLKTEEEWDPIQIKFLGMHKYFTKTAIEERREAKLERLEEIKQRVENGNK